MLLILKNKIDKYVTSISKNVYIDKLDDIINKYNHTYHRTIKMKLVDVKPNMNIDFNKENNKESSKIKIGDYVRISKYKNVFTKGYVPNCSDESSMKQVDLLKFQIELNICYYLVLKDMMQCIIGLDIL